MSSLELPDGEFEPALRMRVDSNPLVGIFAASFAAGPLFLAIATVGATAQAALSGDYSTADLFWRDDSSLQAIVVSIIGGLIVSFVPNAVGCMALGRLGSIVPVIRHWLVWMSTGAMTGAALVLAVGGWAEAATLIIGAAVGAGCATICRAFTRWLPL